MNSLNKKRGLLLVGRVAGWGHTLAAEMFLRCTAQFVSEQYAPESIGSRGMERSAFEKRGPPKRAFRGVPRKLAVKGSMHPDLKKGVCLHSPTVSS